MKELDLRELPAFAPHPLLRGGNRQTIAGAYLLGERPTGKAERTILNVSDGDQIVIHDEAPSAWENGTRIAVLLHGLGGSHRSSYVVRTARKLRERGVRTVSVDLRGCGDGLNLAHAPGHAGRSDDAATVIQHLAELYSQSPVTLLGFSLGANIALKLAGEVGSTGVGNLDSCWAACPPMQIQKCAENMRRPGRRLYSRVYIRSLMKILRRRDEAHLHLQDFKRTQRPKFIDDFDRVYTAPRSGFASIEHYYESASSAQLLPMIRIPTMIIAAEDDPIIPIDIFHSVDFSSDVEIHAINSGGHLGFIARPGVDPDRRWLDWRAIEFVLQNGLYHAPRHDRSHAFAPPVDSER